MRIRDRQEMYLNDRTTVGSRQVAGCLYHFLEDEVLPAAGIDPPRFWPEVAQIFADLTPDRSCPRSAGAICPR